MKNFCAREFSQLLLDTVIDEQAVVGADQDIALPLFTKGSTQITFKQNLLAKLLELARLGIQAGDTVACTHPEHTVTVYKHTLDPVVTKRISDTFLILHEYLGRIAGSLVINDHSFTEITNIEPSLSVIDHTVHAPSVKRKPLLAGSRAWIKGIQRIRRTQPPLSLTVMMDAGDAHGR